MSSNQTPSFSLVPNHHFIAVQVGASQFLVAIILFYGHFICNAFDVPKLFRDLNALPYIYVSRCLRFSYPTPPVTGAVTIIFRVLLFTVLVVH